MKRRTEELIFNLQTDMALRRDEKNYLKKVIGNQFQPEKVREAAQKRLEQLDQDDADSLKELERLRSEKT